MRTRNSLISTTVISAVACAVVGAGLAAAPAHAEYYSTTDPADASPSLTDIRSMRAKHGQANLLVKVRFRELMRSSAAGVSVYIDTDRRSRGPEYVLSSGLGDGTDYVLTEATRWQGSDARVDCEYDARLKWGAKNTFRVRISRECLGEPDSVRVSAKMVDRPDGSRAVVDWTPGTRRWSLPIETGSGVGV